MEAHARYYGRLTALAMLRLGDLHAAQDVASDTLEALARCMRKGTPPRNCEAWLVTVAKRRIIDHVRGHRRHHECSLDVLEHLPPRTGRGGDNLGDQVVEALEGEQTARSLRDAIRRLSESQRMVLALRVTDGLSVAETAHVLNKSPVAVRGLQYRALRTLRAQVASPALATTRRPEEQPARLRQRRG